MRRPRSNRTRTGTAAVCLLLAAVACTGTGDPAPTSSPGDSIGAAGTTAATGTTAPADVGDYRLPGPSTGTRSSDAAMERLCVRPAAPEPRPIPTQSTGDQPGFVLDTEQRIQEFREMTYLTPVPVEDVTRAQLASQLETDFDREYPQELMDRRSTAWQAMGLVPAGTDLREAFHAYVSTRPGARYDVHTNVLSLVEDERLGPVAHFGLVYGLASALDDQRFELARVDPILDACDDEAWMAAQGVIQGSASYFATQTALRTFPPGDQPAISPEARFAMPEGVPPFVHALEVWPAETGGEFVGIISDVQEIEAINEHFGQLPPSTEQIIHREKIGQDQPVPVDVPDLGPALGDGWSDLDVMDAGEAWLEAMLALRLAEDEAAAGAAGWGGGRYRAWTDGSDTAVLLETSWDTPKDAGEFLTAVRNVDRRRRHGRRRHNGGPEAGRRAVRFGPVGARCAGAIAQVTRISNRSRPRPEAARSARGGASPASGGASGRSACGRATSRRASDTEIRPRARRGTG